MSIFIQSILGFSLFAGVGSLTGGAAFYLRKYKDNFDVSHVYSVDDAKNVLAEGFYKSVRFQKISASLELFTWAYFVIALFCAWSWGGVYSVGQILENFSATVDTSSNAYQRWNLVFAALFFAMRYVSMAQANIFLFETYHATRMLDYFYQFLGLLFFISSAMNVDVQYRIITYIVIGALIVLVHFVLFTASPILHRAPQFLYHATNAFFLIGIFACQLLVDAIGDYPNAFMWVYLGALLFWLIANSVVAIFHGNNARTVEGKMAAWMGLGTQQAVYTHLSAMISGASNLASAALSVAETTPREF